MANNRENYYIKLILEAVDKSTPAFNALERQVDGLNKRISELTGLNEKQIDSDERLRDSIKETTRARKDSVNTETQALKTARERIQTDRELAKARIDLRKAEEDLAKTISDSRATEDDIDKARQKSEEKRQNLADAAKERRIEELKSETNYADQSLQTQIDLVSAEEELEKIRDERAIKRAKLRELQNDKELESLRRRSQLIEEALSSKTDKTLADTENAKGKPYTTEQGAKKALREIEESIGKIKSQRGGIDDISAEVENLTGKFNTLTDKTAGLRAEINSLDRQARKFAEAKFEKESGSSQIESVTRRIQLDERQSQQVLEGISKENTARQQQIATDRKAGEERQKILRETSKEQAALITEAEKLGVQSKKNGEISSEANKGVRKQLQEIRQEYVKLGGAASDINKAFGKNAAISDKERINDLYDRSTALRKLNGELETLQKRSDAAAAAGNIEEKSVIDFQREKVYAEAVVLREELKKIFDNIEAEVNPEINPVEYAQMAAAEAILGKPIKKPVKLEISSTEAINRDLEAATDKAMRLIQITDEAQRNNAKLRNLTAGDKEPERKAIAVDNLKLQEEFQKLQADLAAEERKLSIKIKAEINPSESDLARLELIRAVLGRDINIDVEFKESNWDIFRRGARDLFKELSDGAERSSRGIAAFDNVIRGLFVFTIFAVLDQLIVAVVSLAGALAALASSAISAGAALGGALVAGAGQALPAIGVLAAFANRVKNVFDAVKQANLLQQQESYKGGQQASKQASALNGVVAAQERVLEAQKNLTEARKEAREALEDLILSERKQSLTAKEAQLKLRSATGEGGILGAENRQLASDEASLRLSRTRGDLRERLRGGISGSPEVTRAQKQLKDAQRALEQAKQSSADAGSAVSAAGGKLDFLLANLSKSERQLYKQLIDLQNAWRKFSQSITDPLTKSFTFAARRVTKILEDKKIIKAGQSLSNALGKSFTDVFNSVLSPQVVNRFLALGKEFEKNLIPVTAAAKSLVNIFLDLAEAGSPALREILKYVSQLILSLERYTSSTKGKNELTKFFTDGVQPLKQFTELLLAFGDVILALMGPGGGMDAGATVLEQITGALKDFADQIRDEDSKVNDFFERFFKFGTEILPILAPIVKSIAVLLDQLFTEQGLQSVKDLGEIITEVVIPAFSEFLKFLRLFISTINFLLTDIPVVSGLLRGLLVGTITAALVASFVGKFKKLFEPIYAFARWTRGTKLGSKIADDLILRLMLLKDKAIQAWGALRVGFSNALPGGGAFKKWGARIGTAARLGFIAGFTYLFADDIAKAITKAAPSLKPYSANGRKVGDNSFLIFDKESWKNFFLGEQTSSNQDFNKNELQQARKFGTTGPTKQKSDKKDSKKKSKQITNQEAEQFFSSFDPQTAKMSDEIREKVAAYWRSLRRAAKIASNEVISEVRDMRSKSLKSMNDFVDKARDQMRLLNNSFRTRMTSIANITRNQMLNVKLAVYDAAVYVRTTLKSVLSDLGADSKISIKVEAPKKAPTAGDVKQAAGGGWIGNRGERGRDTVPTWLGRGEAVLNWQHQRLVEPALQQTYGFGLDGMFDRSKGYHAGGPNTAPGFARGRRGARNGIYTASVYNDPQGYKGDALARNPYNWAELGVNGGVGNAFGNLPYKTKIRVSYKGRSVNLTKLDIGSGGPGIGGKTRAVDIWQTAANKLRLPGLANVYVSFTGGTGNSGSGGAEAAQEIAAPIVKGGSAAMRRLVSKVVGKMVSAGNSKISRLAPASDMGGGIAPVGADEGGSTIIDGKPVANWIARILMAARRARVSFRVSSGLRSYAEQTRLWNQLGRDPAIVARPGTSNHEGTQWPRGAVDISPGWENLKAWLNRNKRYGQSLKHYGNPRDPYHFSAQGNAQGGFIGMANGGRAMASKRSPMFGGDTTYSGTPSKALQKQWEKYHFDRYVSWLRQHHHNRKLANGHETFFDASGNEYFTAIKGSRTFNTSHLSPRDVRDGNWEWFNRGGRMLQHFANGGTVGGPDGHPVPIIAHAGEWVLNKRHQSRVAQMAGTTRDRLRGMLGFTGGPTSFAGSGEVKKRENKAQSFLDKYKLPSLLPLDIDGLTEIVKTVNKQIDFLNKTSIKKFRKDFEKFKDRLIDLTDPENGLLAKLGEAVQKKFDDASRKSLLESIGFTKIGSLLATDNKNRSRLVKGIPPADLSKAAEERAKLQEEQSKDLQTLRDNYVSAIIRIQRKIKDITKKVGKGDSGKGGFDKRIETVEKRLKELNKGEESDGQKKEIKTLEETLKKLKSQQKKYGVLVEGRRDLTTKISEIEDKIIEAENARIEALKEASQEREKELTAAGDLLIKQSTFNKSMGEIIATFGGTFNGQSGQQLIDSAMGTSTSIGTNEQGARSRLEGLKKERDTMFQQFLASGGDPRIKERVDELTASVLEGEAAVAQAVADRGANIIAGIQNGLEEEIKKIDVEAAINSARKTIAELTGDTTTVDNLNVASLESAKSKQKQINDALVKAQAELANNPNDPRLQELVNNLRQQSAESAANVAQAQAEIIQNRISQIEEAFQRGETYRGFAERRAAIQDRLGNNTAAFNARNEILTGRGSAIQAEINNLRAIQADPLTNEKQRQELEDKIAELTVSLEENTQETKDLKIAYLENQADQNFQRSETARALRERAANLLERSGFSGAAFSQRQSILQSRISSQQDQADALRALLNDPVIANNPAKIEELTNKIADLDMSIQENTRETLDLSLQYQKAQVDLINERTSTTTGLLGNVQTIFENISKINGTADNQDRARIAQQTGVALNTEAQLLAQQVRDVLASGTLTGEGGNTDAINLLQQLLQAFSTGDPGSFAGTLESLSSQIQNAAFAQGFDPEQRNTFLGLINALTNNTIQVTDNTAQLRELNGIANQPQPFSSTSWTRFRAAIFNGLGDALPQYNIPQMATGGYITKGGMFELHPGEFVVKSDASNINQGDINITVNEANRPLDVTALASRIAFEKRTRK